MTLHFDVWARATPNGTALGELTSAYDKQFRAVHQAMGEGLFTINRHDAQYAWCATDNLVRVRREAGGPFAYDDARYIGAFWIESGADTVISPDEEGGEEVKRGGRSAEACLRRAVIYPDADFSGDENFTTQTRIDGNWHLRNRTGGEVFRILLRNAKARTPDPLAMLSTDFNVNVDSDSVAWSDTDTDWSFPVGTNMLDALGTLVSGDLYYRVGADFVMHAYENEPGTDLSATITFAKGVNIAEAAERQIHAREAVSRTIVQGTKENLKLKFYEVNPDNSPISDTVETAIGRREGFIEFKRSPTTAKLRRAGRRYIRRQKQRHDGPTTAQVLEDEWVAFTDYEPGDVVTVNIPGEWDNLARRIYAIVLTEREAGDDDVTVEFEQSPFDPATGEGGEFGDGTDGGKGSCADCPPVVPPPFDPPHPPGLCHLVPGSFGTGGGEGTCTIGSSGDACDTPATITLWQAATYRVVISVTHAASNYLSVNFATAAGGVGNDFGSTRVGNATTHYEETFVVPGDPGFSADHYARLNHVFYVGYSGEGASVAIEVYYVSGPDPRFEDEPCEETTDQTDPANGQVVRERGADGDGTTAADASDFAYEPGSLEVWVAGVDWTLDVTESDPAAGTYVLAHPPPLGASVLRRYQGVGSVSP